MARDVGGGGRRQGMKSALGVNEMHFHQGVPLLAWRIMLLSSLHTQGHSVGGAGRGDPKLLSASQAAILHFLEYVRHP